MLLITALIQYSDNFLLYTCNLYRRRAAIRTFLLVLTRWNEIKKVDKFWKLAVSDRNIIIFAQIDPKKCLSHVSKQSVMFICNILYFAKYFAKYFVKYFAKYSKLIWNISLTMVCHAAFTESPANSTLKELLESWRTKGPFLLSHICGW